MSSLDSSTTRGLPATRSRFARRRQLTRLSLALMSVWITGDAWAIEPSAAEAQRPAWRQCTAAQTRATERWWFFGQRGVLDFGNSGATAQALANPSASAPRSLGGGVSVADRNGGLLFYALGDGNSVRLFNRQHQTLGTLAGNPSASQMAVSFPVADKAGQHVLVTTSYQAGASKAGQLSYTVIDTQANAGLGALVGNAGGQALASTQAGDMLAALPNAFGTGFWVLTATPGQSQAVAVPFIGNTAGAPVVSPLSKKINTLRGALAISADTQWVALLNGGGLTSAGKQTSTLHLLSMNAANGQLKEVRVWTLPQPTPKEEPTCKALAGMHCAATVEGEVTATTQTTDAITFAGVGIDFSPSGQYLYVSQTSDGRLWRYPVASGESSGGSSGAYLGRTGLSKTGGGQVRRGPDGAMWIAHDDPVAAGGRGQAFLSRIANPDEPKPEGIRFVEGNYALPEGASSSSALPQTGAGCAWPIPPTATSRALELTAPANVPVNKQAQFSGKAEGATDDEVVSLRIQPQAAGAQSNAYLLQAAVRGQSFAVQAPPLDVGLYNVTASLPGAGGKHLQAQQVLTVTKDDDGGGGGGGGGGGAAITLQLALPKEMLANRALSISGTAKGAKDGERVEAKLESAITKTLASLNTKATPTNGAGKAAPAPLLPLVLTTPVQAGQFTLNVPGLPEGQYDLTVRLPQQANTKPVSARLKVTRATGPDGTTVPVPVNHPIALSALGLLMLLVPGLRRKWQGKH
ncbi:hypothetical protein G7048_20905 [Diaphorobacter sp. HDW4B]|uniref:hypothetical protein n=1 Tax=Diaphorobacter sp. HDW4B TaxID=2714925 RepID=UPI00140A575D|nr:hypothetical protein [Diaphorobacter sp. HDW4B]QIL72594.1 hypothetical protein G7048_20905 [Diaphorobacter sp. HDW4B]